MNHGSKVAGNLDLDVLRSLVVEQVRIGRVADREEVHGNQHITQTDAAKGSSQAHRILALGLRKPSRELINIFFRGDALSTCDGLENGAASRTTLAQDIDELGTCGVLVCSLSLCASCAA